MLAKSDPLTNSSQKEASFMIDKKSSEFSQEERSHNEDTLTTTQIKPHSETEVNFQEFMSESSFPCDIKQVEYLVPKQNVDGASELPALVSCPGIGDPATKQDTVTDKASVDSSAGFDCRNSRDNLDGEKEDESKTLSQDCDIFVLDGLDVYVSNNDAAGTIVLRQHPKTDESRSEPDLLDEEDKTNISEEIPPMDIAMCRRSSQNDDGSPSEIFSLVHSPKIAVQTNKKQDFTQCFEYSTVSEDLDFMMDSIVEYREDIKDLSKCVTLENVSLSPHPISEELKSELGDDQPFSADRHLSGDEEPVDLLIQTCPTKDKAAELSLLIPLAKIDTSQKKQKKSLLSKDSEKWSEESADVFEKNDNGFFEDSTSSEDADVQVTVHADEIDMLHASSKSSSEASPETVSSRFFGFEELLPTTIEKPIKHEKSRAGPKYSNDPEEVFEIRTLFDSDQTLSPSENEYCIPPGYDEVSAAFDYNAVQINATSPIFELSDTETYFDCKQGASDFSETESEEPYLKLYQQPYHYPKKQKDFQEILLPVESEDYVDYPLTYEPLCNVQEESEDDNSDEEFTLCEAPPQSSVCETGARSSGDDDDDTNESMLREIEAELGTLSESSDDDFLTTRIIRRRVIIKADEMNDFPPQSISEETYMDENGHTVVKKVTRTVIRKCASSDGAALEQASSEAGAHSSIRVVKRTVVKSEGDQSEVTFTECKSLPKQDEAEGGRPSRVEKGIVLEGERTVTHHGNVSLGSDIPSAQDDFTQARLSYLSNFRNSDHPCLGKSETVKDDGTLVKRNQMRKVCSMKQTVVKGAGRRKQMLLERREGSRIGSKSSDLKQHLHQLFHHHNKQNHREDTDKKNTS